MKLGEKLQQLRKKSGLSQEQLAAQLTVSRQAVSKWELDDAVPDTENVVQLSRIFGVTCDYLLREELDEPDGPQPTPPGESHLTEQRRVHNARILSLAICAIGLLLALGGWLHYTQFSELFIIASVIVQVLGLALFELAASRMGDDRALARLDFYRLSCWLMFPVLISALDWYAFWQGRAVWLSLPELVVFTLPMGGLTSGILSVLRRRARAKA